MSNIWQRFRQVTNYVPENRRVYRSSAPNYDGNEDESQNLTDDAVRFLRERNITGIISFNLHSYRPAELARLNAANIQYIHLPVRDFAAPTLDQLLAAYNFVVRLGNGSGTLVHCGYGHGRTGTGITGIQLHTTRGANPDQSLWMSDNNVERPVQMEVLIRLRDSFPRTEVRIDVIMAGVV